MALSVLAIAWTIYRRQVGQGVGARLIEPVPGEQPQFVPPFRDEVVAGRHGRTVADQGVGRRGLAQEAARGALTIHRGGRTVLGTRFSGESLRADSTAGDGGSCGSCPPVGEGHSFGQSA